MKVPKTAYPAFVIAALVFGAWLAATSSGPTSNPAKIVQVQQPLTPNDQRSETSSQRGTEDAPIFVKVIPIPKPREEAEQERVDREEKASSDRHLVLLTGVLAAATVGLFIATIALVGATNRAREDAIAVQRAYVAHEPNGAHFASTGFDLVDKVLTPNQRGPLKYFENNSGKTPAKDIQMYVRVVDGVGIPSTLGETLLPIERQDVIGYAPTGQNIGRIIETPSKQYFRTDQFFLYGYVDYTDIFENRWRHRFAFSHDPNRGATMGEAWIAHGDHHYERRLRRKDDGTWRECLTTEEDD